MGYAELKCRNCGAVLKADENDQTVRCFYCGSALAHDPKHMALQGLVGIDGMATMTSLLERAFLLIEDGEFEKAGGYLERVLDIAPKCAKAYWGRLMCAHKARNEAMLLTLPYTLDASGDYQKAAAFAQEEEKRTYLAVNEKLHEKMSSGWTQAPKAAPSGPAAGNRGGSFELSILRADIRKETIVWSIMLILIIVLGAFLGFMLIGFIAMVASEGVSLYEVSLMGVITFVLCVPVYFSWKRYDKAKRNLAQYRSKERAILYP